MTALARRFLLPRRRFVGQQVLDAEDFFAAPQVIRRQTFDTWDEAITATADWEPVTMLEVTQIESDGVCAVVTVSREMVDSVAPELVARLVEEHLAHDIAHARRALL